MAWNGSGTFTRTNGSNTGSGLWAADAAAGTKITAANHDTHDEDIATAVNACLTKNNETKPTADFVANADATYDLGSAAVGWVNSYLTGDVVFDERADHAETPAAGKGQIWVKNDTPSSLMYTDDAGSDFILSGGVAAVSGHIKAGNLQRLDGSASGLSAVTISGLMAAGAFETFGPTGSGATNIWTAMDNIPSSATMMLCHARLIINAADGDINEVSLNGAVNGVTASAGIGSSQMAGLEFEASAAGEESKIEVDCIVPLDSSQICQIGWDSAGAGTMSAVLYYRGFMTD